MFIPTGLLAGLFSCVQSQVNLSSTIPDSDNIVRRGYSVTFTCVVRGSNILAWSSPQYIGMTNRLEFSSVSHPSTIRKPNNYTTAVLESVYHTTAEVELTSTLHIIVQPYFNVSTVTCHSVGTDQVKSVDFRFSGMHNIQNILIAYIHIVPSLTGNLTILRV